MGDAVAMPPATTTDPTLDNAGPSESAFSLASNASVLPQSASANVDSLYQDAEGPDAFSQALLAAGEAIELGIYPELIPEGSSGSYFVKDRTGQTIGVFKPKDEEPFAEFNPKWPKFFQKFLCFCCFGRACLVRNTGYLAEAGASIVDQKLQLNVVPETRVVKLQSPTFYYRRACYQNDVHPKVGSFQLFVRGYEPAAVVFGRWNYDPTLMAKAEYQKFLQFFQRLVVLDYVIRNTDRHLDNWLIRHVPGQELHIAAIDNGLSFPLRHPECASRLRTYPFRWARLPYAHEPWDPELRRHLLEVLNPAMVHDLCVHLEHLFRTDPDNNRLLVAQQISVTRAQLWSLHEALETNHTPHQLAERIPFLTRRKHKRRPDTNDWSDWFVRKTADDHTRSCC